MTRMGYPCAYESAKEIMEEISAVTPSFGGINYERLEKESLQWPCRSLTDPYADYACGQFCSWERFI